MEKNSVKYKGYKTSLILSAIIITTVFIVVISQIIKLKSSGDQIISHLNKARYYNKLVLHLETVEEKFFKNTLSLHFLDSIENENLAIIKRLENSDTDHSAFVKNHEKIYAALRTSINTNQEQKVNLEKFHEIINKGKSLKKDLINRHDALAFINAVNFSDNNSVFPPIFIISTIISLVILLFSLYKIFEARKDVIEKSNILETILRNTNDIANFYKPVYNKYRELVDFKITYASKANVFLIDKPIDEIIGSSVSESYPFLKESGVLSQLIHAYQTQTYFEKILEIPIKKKMRVFNARFIPVKQGLQVMITELTKLYNKQEELENMYKELFIKNRLFQEAEKTAKLGSYVWYMRKDQTTMSDNVYRMLGYEPQEFPMSAKKFREFAHPDDREMYDEAIKAAYTNKKPVEFIFRIVTLAEEIKYIYTKGDFSERDGVQIMVGVIQDVTMRVANENKLKEQNIELIAQNEELDTFNRIASHDLQEPLRKIQMFISRISDLEKETLSERAAMYFSKIESASSKMRKLINNLLAFSRIDNKEYDFEYIQLNSVLDDVLDTFSEAISENNIQVTINSLPSVNAIPFLIEQLFANLISNAIKYRNKNKQSKISVESNKVHGKQIPHNFIKTHAYYHRIKVIDNGIGFDDSDKQKVFQLFKRLHDTDMYSGTGLGLAICHKIVMRHKGYIYATSVPETGSIFTIFLPSGKLRLLPKKYISG